MKSKIAFECRKISALKRSRNRLVRQIAYEIYVSRLREGIPGDTYSDWMQAEKELGKLTGVSVASSISDQAVSSDSVSSTPG
jgi:predicted amino acid racemase